MKGGDSIDRLYLEILDSGALCPDPRRSHLALADAASEKAGE